MPGTLIPDLFRRVIDASGLAVPGAIATFYLSGTTTLTNIYTSAAMSVALANPLQADSGGLFSEIFLDPAVTYRRVLTLADGTPLLDDDPINGAETTAAALAYSTSITPNTLLGAVQEITITDNVAFAINTPLNPTTGRFLTLTIRNSSGGALGAITWSAAFKMATWTSPANTKQRSINFYYSPAGNWVEASRTASDVPLG